MTEFHERVGHPAFHTAAATLIGYAITLLVVFAVVFVVPYLLLFG